MKRENVIFSLVNRETFKEILENIPNRDFEDLSVVYYEFFPEENMCKLVNCETMSEEGLSEQELYDLAYENTRRLLPPEVMKMSDKVKSLEPELVEDDEEVVSNEMYVVGNEQGLFGATSILYQDTMEELSNTLGGDYILLPSSKHEFIAIPKTDDTNIDELQNMVHDINQMVVEPRDQLSDQVYEYDASLGRVKQVTFGSPSNILEEESKQNDESAEEEVEEVESLGGQNPM